MRTAKFSSLAVFLAIPVLAQTDATYLLVSSNTVSPTTPTTTVEVWATWADPGAEWVFSRGNYDLSAGDGVFSNPVNVLNARGSTTGVITGNMISGAFLGQFHIPSIGLIGLRDNPILLATYDWTTTNFTARRVSLDTSNTGSFLIVTWDGTNTIQLFPNSFTAGSGVINVVPGPAAWFVVAVPLAACTRRRRR